MFFYFFGLAIVLIGYFLYWLSAEDQRKEKEKIAKRNERTTHVRKIKKMFPNAFQTYWDNATLANSVMSRYSNSRLSADSRLWKYNEWKILEDDLKFGEGVKKYDESIDSMIKTLDGLRALKERDPAMYEKWKRENPGSTIEDIASNINYTIRKRNLEASRVIGISSRDFV